MIQADQAIFTSIRTHTGEGYRIIAASSGVTVDERSELTRRSPSHDSLCSSADGAVAVIGYALQSGRYCVSYSRYAGREQTARGGQRVYTHMAILDDGRYRKFQYSPVAVGLSLAHAVGQTLTLKSEKLSVLELTVGNPDAEPKCSGFGTACDEEWLMRVVSAVLGGRQLVVAGAGSPLEMLEWVLRLLPLSMRAALSSSIAAKWSAGRGIQLAFVDEVARQKRPSLAGHGVELFDVGSDVGPGESDIDSRCAGYVRTLGRWWREDRLSDIVACTNKLTRQVDIVELDDLARGWSEKLQQVAESS